MKKQYLSAFLFLAFIFGTPFLVSAMSDSPEVVSINEDQNENESIDQDDQGADLDEDEDIDEDQDGRHALRADFEAKRAEMDAKRAVLRAEFEAKRAEMDAKREAHRLEFEAKRAEMQDKRVEFQQRNAERKVERATRVMLATIDRLERIILRIESRIAKIQEKGGETTESEGFVAAAKVNLADARVAVEAFALIDLSGDNAQENYESIRTAAAVARELIREAHQNLMLAVRSLSSVEVEIEDESSDNDNLDEQ